jgi:hypothetical protein
MNMRSVQVSKPKGPLEMVEKDIPEPGVRQVRIRVQACGICHSDSMMKEGLFPGLTYPRLLRQHIYDNHLTSLEIAFYLLQSLGYPQILSMTRFLLLQYLH